MTQHELITAVRVVPAYEVDTLGAPFRVTLLDSVHVNYDPKLDKDFVHIPDFVGMVNALVRSRAIHPRKLGGSEITFLRKALGVRAKSLASYLDISAEHLSRCETGSKVLSSASERMLRLFVFLATFYESAEDLLAKLDQPEVTAEPTRKAKVSELGEAFLQYFLTLRIQTVFSADEPLHFELVRRPAEEGVSPNLDEGDWSSRRLAA